MKTLMYECPDCGEIVQLENKAALYIYRDTTPEGHKFYVKDKDCVNNCFATVEIHITNISQLIQNHNGLIIDTNPQKSFRQPEISRLLNASHQDWTAAFYNELKRDIAIQKLKALQVRVVHNISFWLIRKTGYA